jgi:hypothetical protein
MVILILGENTNLNPFSYCKSLKVTTVYQQVQIFLYFTQHYTFSINRNCAVTLRKQFFFFFFFLQSRRENHWI